MSEQGFSITYAQYKALESKLSQAEQDRAALTEANARMREALTKIRFELVSDVTDGSGPEDSTPREKGYMRYCGWVHTLAVDALKDIPPSVKVRECERKVLEAAMSMRCKDGHIGCYKTEGAAVNNLAKALDALAEARKQEAKR